MSKILFVSGVHGVGKSTLCKEISARFGWSHYACSDLIKQNSSYVESSKQVSSAKKNQEALLHGLRLIDDNVILLDGHFCLLSSDSSIIKLDTSVFDSISPIGIINVTCNENMIFERLMNRDGKGVGLEVLKILQASESSQAYQYSEKSKIPLLKYNSPDLTENLLLSLDEFYFE